MEPSARMFNHEALIHRSPHVDLVSLNNSILPLTALIKAKDQVVCPPDD